MVSTQNHHPSQNYYCHYCHNRFTSVITVPCCWSCSKADEPVIPFLIYSLYTIIFQSIYNTPKISYENTM